MGRYTFWSAHLTLTTHCALNENNNNNGVSKDSIDLGCFVLPAHVYSRDPKIPHIINDCLFDSGAGWCYITVAAVKELGLSKQVEKIDEPPSLGADRRPLEGAIGRVSIKLGLEDSNNSITEPGVFSFKVYKDMNHKMIIGRTALGGGPFSNTVCYPPLDILLFNCSNKQFSKYSKLVNRHKTWSSKNDISNKFVKPAFMSSKNNVRAVRALLPCKAFGEVEERQPDCS